MGAPGTMDGKGLWEPYLLLLDDGRLTALYSNEAHSGYSQIVSQKVSNDGGTTWGAEIRAVEEPRGGSLRPGMPVLARMTDDRYLLVYEIVGLGRADVHCKVSQDGITWDDGLGRRIPYQHCGPFAASVADGRVFVTSCENRLSVSEDLGESWIPIEPAPWDLGFAFSWPALYEIRNGELGAVVSSGEVRLRIGSFGPPEAPPDRFQDSFSGNEDDGWTQHGGTFELASGRYRLLNEDAYGKALAGSVFWDDGTLEADVALATDGDAGLVFRMTNPEDTGPDAGFGYYVGLDSRDFVILGRMDDGWTALAQAPMTVDLDAWYHLRIDLQGDRIAVFVNGTETPRIVHRDGSYRRGQIGVRSFRCDAGFDNVVYQSGAPFPECGHDPTPDELSCHSYPGCRVFF